MGSVTLEIWNTLVPGSEGVIGTVRSKVIPSAGSELYLVSKGTEQREWEVIKIEYLFDMDFPDNEQRVVVHTKPKVLV